MTPDIGKIFPPILIVDSIGDVYVAINIGGIFFRVSETGEYSRETLLIEVKNMSDDSSSRSHVFNSLTDEKLKKHFLEEC